MNPPKIAVLLAVRNGESKLARTIESLERQTLPRPKFAVFVRDDASDDRTPRMLDEYARAGRCVVTGRNATRLGLTKTLNTMLNETRSELVARVDCGDICAPARLERQLAYLDAHPEVAAVCSSAEIFIPPDRRIGPTFELWGTEVAMRHLKLKNPIHHGSVMVRRQAVEAVGLYNEERRYAQDLDLWLKLISAGHRIHWLKDALYSLEVDPGSISAANAEAQAAAADAIRDDFPGAQGPGAKRMDIDRMLRLARLRDLPVLGKTFRAFESLIYELRCF
jgi:glycosyltransferase involved in cell wall biosynthesis